MDLNITDNTTVSIGIIIAVVTACGWIYSQVSKARKSVEDNRLVTAVAIAELKTKMEDALALLNTIALGLNRQDEKIARLEARVAVLESKAEE